LTFYRKNVSRQLLPKARILPGLFDDGIAIIYNICAVAVRANLQSLLWTSAILNFYPTLVKVFIMSPVPGTRLRKSKQLI